MKRLFIWAFSEVIFFFFYNVVLFYQNIFLNAKPAWYLCTRKKKGNPLIFFKYNICLGRFLSFEQKLIHLPLVYWLIQWLTDWLPHSLICPHNALKNWQKVEKAYSGQTLAGFKQVTWPTLLGGNNQRIFEQEQQ